MLALRSGRHAVEELALVMRQHDDTTLWMARRGRPFRRSAEADGSLQVANILRSNRWIVASELDTGGLCRAYGRVRTGLGEGRSAPLERR